MSSLFTELSLKARQLSLEERAQLAEELLESLQEPPDHDVATAWDGEISRRLDDYRRGEAKLIPAEEVFAEARRLTR